MVTELFKHSWPRLWPEYAALGRTERAAYQDAVLQQVDGLHKTVAAEAEGEATTCTVLCRVEPYALWATGRTMYIVRL